jgi:Bacterial protein of unknown function (YtfJ_HI0045)
MQRNLKKISTLGSLITLLSGSAHAGEVNMDAVVETSGGAQTHLNALWSRPTVLFYEDKESNQLNQHVKDALFLRGKEKGLLDQVNVIAVANVAAFNWFPARNFVLAAVRDIEAHVHVPVYLDFQGSLTVPPWSLAAKSSTVLVLSARGEVLWSVRGKLTDAQLATLFETLEGQLAR